MRRIIEFLKVDISVSGVDVQVTCIPLLLTLPVS